MSQFRLFRQRRFGPFFATQFLGAFNDNLFKNAIVILIAFGGLSASDADALVNISAGIFILPFFLFSATGGQLADKFEKSRLIRIIKLAEIAIMALAAVGFVLHSVPLLLGVLFLMGTQSTMFGPVKYSILPEHLREAELVGGNGMVEAGTFVAILIGTIAGGLLIAMQPLGPVIVAGCVIALAIAGWLASRAIPIAEATAPDLRLRYNPLTETVKLIKCARQERVVFIAIIAISWFWFYGALFLAQFPGYARSFLAGNEQVVTIMLAAFSIGIGVGSSLCERMSGGRIELGLVPLGAIGLTLFAVDLYLASPGQALPVGTAATVGAAEFFGHLSSWRIVIDLTLLGVFGGWFIVPLYALMQHRSAPEHRSRVIAANNVLNALFMVAAAGIAIGLRSAGVSVTELFVLTGLCNALVLVVVMARVPELSSRFVVWLLSRTMLRAQARGLEHGPGEGGAVLCCNDVGPAGILALSALWRSTVRFVVPAPAPSRGALRWVLRDGGPIEIGSASGDDTGERAPAARDVDAELEEVAAALARGEQICLFCGFQDGSAGDERFGLSSARLDEGLARLIAQAAVPVVPVALRGLDAAESDPSRRGLLGALLARGRPEITVEVGPAHDGRAAWRDASQALSRLLES